MEYKRETLGEIRQRALKSLGAGSIPYSFKGLLANSIAGMTYMLHGHIDYLTRNMLPDTSMGSHLDQWAKLWGLSRHEATKTRVTIESSGPISPSSIPEVWYIGRHRFLYSRNTQGRIELVAEEAGPIEIDETSAQLENTHAVIDSTAPIINVAPAQPEETDESLRRRVLRAIRIPPQGGAYSDYIKWAESVPGVRQAWVRPSYLVGTPGVVEVTFLEDDLQQTVTTKARIEKALAKLAPAHAEVRVVMQQKKKVELKYQITPESARAAADKAIADFFKYWSRPGGYLGIDHEKTPSSLPLSLISEVISSVEGEENHRIISPTGDISIAEGGLLYV